MSIAHDQAMREFVVTMEESRSETPQGRDWLLTHAEVYSHRHWSSSSHDQIRVRGQLLLPETRPETVLSWLINEQMGV